VAAVQIIGFVGGWEGLVVAYEAAELGQPGEGAFHDPAAVEQDKALGLAGALDDRHGCKEAVVTTTARSSPPVSTATCRLRPLIFFPPSYPLLAVVAGPPASYDAAASS
jgi:hypothetical protein